MRVNWNYIVYVSTPLLSLTLMIYSIKLGNIYVAVPWGLLLIVEIYKLVEVAIKSKIKS